MISTLTYCTYLQKKNRTGEVLITCSHVLDPGTLVEVVLLLFKDFLQGSFFNRDTMRVHFYFGHSHSVGEKQW